MKAVLSFSFAAFALAALAAPVGCRREQLPVADHPRSFRGVAMRDVTFYSPALTRNMTYRVYLPAQVSAHTKLQSVYLLHGCDGTFRDWSNYSDVGAYASKGLILVMVDGDCSYYMNAALGSRERYEDYFIRDTVANVEAHFPIASDRADRAVVGVSMGGFAAVELALTHPDLFIFAGATSPAIDVPSRRFTLRRWQQSVRFRSIFGPSGSEARIQRDPFFLVRTADPSETPYLYITAGKQEPLFAPIVRFAAVIKQRQFSSEFHSKPGGHDWSQWDDQIPGCFDSLLAHIQEH